MFRARSLLKRFGADVVVGTGGYTTAAVLIAQRTRGGKIVIHEQNAVPGRTNRWLARVADRVCLSVEDTRRFFPDDRAEFTGMPIREEFADLPDKAAARRSLGLKEEAFTVLVAGGSQGARVVNDLMLAAWPIIDNTATQVLHQVGARNIDRIDPRKIPNAAMYHIEGYLDMPVALASADLVVARAGASTLAEITAAGLASILIPYPHAYADHQTLNAKHLVECNAAVMLEEATATPERLAEAVTNLRDVPDKLEQMASASAALGKPDAADKVADAVFSLENRC